MAGAIHPPLARKAGFQSLVRLRGSQVGLRGWAKGAVTLTNMGTLGSLNGKQI